MDKGFSNYAEFMDALNTDTNHRFAVVLDYPELKAGRIYQDRLSGKYFYARLGKYGKSDFYEVIWSGEFDADVCGPRIAPNWYQRRDCGTPSDYDAQILSAVRDIKGLADEFLAYVDGFGNQCAHTDRIVEKIVEAAYRLPE